MDEFEAIEKLKVMLEVMTGTAWEEPVRIALEALKDKAGYCEECQINYDKD